MKNIIFFKEEHPSLVIVTQDQSKIGNIKAKELFQDDYSIVEVDTPHVILLKKTRQLLDKRGIHAIKDGTAYMIAENVTHEERQAIIENKEMPYK